MPTFTVNTSKVKVAKVNSYPLSVIIQDKLQPTVTNNVNPKELSATVNVNWKPEINDIDLPPLSITKGDYLGKKLTFRVYAKDANGDQLKMTGEACRGGVCPTVVFGTKAGEFTKLTNYYELGWSITDSTELGKYAINIIVTDGTFNTQSMAIEYYQNLEVEIK